MSKVIGIDLGTTNSVAAVYDRNGPRILLNANGQRTTPSIVAFTEDGEILVGDKARDQQVTNPHQTIYSVKRFMGRRHDEVSMEEKIVPYGITSGKDNYVQIRVDKKLYTPAQISGMILHEIKRVAEEDLGEPVTRAVITVPAYFNDAQRQATIDAGAIAGLTVERIINEPTAAALAYGIERKGRRRIVVFDFGGGTFDLSALELGDGEFKVLAVHGNTHLGGDDFDQRIIDVVADDFRRRECVDLRENPMALQRLKEAAERAKSELSMRPEAMISLPYVCVDKNGPKHLEYTLGRERFEAICSDLFDNLRRSCRILMAEANIKPGQIDDIVMVGGSTRIPMVQKLAREVFQTDNLDKSINPDEVVALGAATLGGVLQGDLHNVHLMDVTSQSLGVETAQGEVKVLIPRNTHIPTTVKEMFSTPRDNQTSVPVNILEGDEKKAVDNRPLATVRLKGIRRAPRGVPRIEVEFVIDADGILKVTATDVDTGKAQDVVITGGCGLADNELDQMQETTRLQGRQVEQRREQVDLRNHAERIHTDMQRWLDHNGRLLPGKAAGRIETTMDKLAKKIARNDLSGIRAMLRKLDEVSQPYRKAG